MGIHFHFPADTDKSHTSKDCLQFHRFYQPFPSLSFSTAELALIVSHSGAAPRDFSCIAYLSNNVQIDLLFLTLDGQLIGRQE